MGRPAAPSLARSVAAAAAVGLALRMLGRLASPWRDVDGASYVELVDALARGQGLDAAGLRYWPPLYPGLSALLSAGLGLAPRLSAGVVAALASVALVVPAALLARRLGGPRAGGMAAWATALLPPLVMAGHRDHAESLGLLLLLGAMALAAGDAPALRRGLGAGLLLGFSFLTRYELVLGLPALLLLLARGPARGRALTGLLIGLAAPLLPYQALLLHLGEGWVVPDTRLASNLAETLSAGTLGFGFDEPGALRDHPAAQEELSVAADRLDELGRALAQLPRALPLSVAALAVVGGRSLGARRALPFLLLGLPCLASALVVDHESRYWLSLTVALLPLAAVGLAGLDRRAWPLVALGLLAWPRATFPDGPLSVFGPGEGMVASLRAPALALQAAEGGLVLLLRPAVLGVGLAAVLSWVIGARGRAPGLLLVAASLCGLAVTGLEHARASLPERPLEANLGLADSLPMGARLLCARPLDAHVAFGTFVPPPRPGLPPAEVDAYTRARGVEFVLIDPDDPRAAGLTAWAQAELAAGRLLAERRVGRLQLARRRP